MQLGRYEEFHPLGVTIAEAHPIGIQNVQLLPGLNVLYGKNGSGKTKILEAVKRQLMGFAEPEVPLSSPDPRMGLYSTGGIHVRRTPNPGQPPPYTGEGATPTYYTADIWASAGSPRIVDKPGFAWWKYEWDAWISAFLLSEPWGSGKLDWELFRRSGSFSAARKLGLSKSEWLWLLDQERYLIKPSDGRIFLCDPDPYNGPLRDHWMRSQGKWARLFESKAGLGWKNIFWDPELRRWETHYLNDDALLAPLPEILGLATFPEWVAHPVLQIDIEAVWFPKVDSLFEIDDLKTEFKWSPLEDTLIDHLAYNEQAIEKRRRSTIPLPDKVGQFENLSEVCRDLEQRVNSRLEKLFVSPPRIRISDSRTKYLSSNAPLDVKVQVDSLGPWFPITGLGDAHQKYVMKAISIELLSDTTFRGAYRIAHNKLSEQNVVLKRSNLEGLDGSGRDNQIEIRSPGFAFVDEPERGLHPQAEGFLAEGLANLADYVLSTTHSLKVLNTGLKRGCASLVERDFDGNFQIAPRIPTISTRFVSELEKRLGLEPADLVSLISVFVLVEGAHDRAVLEHFLADALTQHRIEIVPMQGTKGVEDLVTSPFLFAATSAPIVVVLDNGRQEEVQNLLQQIRLAPNREMRKQLKNQSIKHFETNEMKAILNLIGQAIEADKLDRIHPFVMSKRDIVDYIPIKNFSDSFDSWEDADRKFLESMKRTFFKPGDGRLRKAWLTKHGVSCTEAGIRQALKVGAANGESRHRDFVDLEELLLRIAR
jgi:hypothetical protein